MIGFPDASTARIVLHKEAQFSIDDIEIISDDLNTTTALEYNSANELTKTTEKFVIDGTTTTNTVTNLTYDAWGNNTKRTRGSNTADYTFGYGNFLTHKNRQK